MSQMPPQAVVHVYLKPMSHLRALHLLRQNISSLLAARHESQTTLAWSLGKGKSWINKFLNETREIQLKDLDRIAEFFGVATYQLFQPGISDLTERRKRERRGGRDRRIGHTGRTLGVVAGQHQKAHPRRTTDLAHEAVESQARQLSELAREITERADAILAQADPRGQTARARKKKPKAPAPDRTDRGSDAPGADRLK